MTLTFDLPLPMVREGLDLLQELLDEHGDLEDYEDSARELLIALYAAVESLHDGDDGEAA